MGTGTLMRRIGEREMDVSGCVSLGKGREGV